ncbi:hypothetical protein BGZ99_004726 [Dissophora globulifera]|uniref:Uncharacterized protein n=1 Tax=Dissophora globulifera TaxID=979702 RepID=A0A9P6RJK1_9FUNG|nr:hypothetical protein BGZ99_004726 [Dissophora globulifera]
MIPSPQKTDLFSPPKSSQRLFSVTAPNPKPPPRQFFRRGSIGSKSWKLGVVNQIQSQIQSGIKSNKHCDISTIQRCESADQNFVHAPRTSNRSPHQSGLCSAFDPPKRLSEESDPAAFSHLFSFKPPRSLHSFASFGSNATGLYSRRNSPTLQSENVATSSTAPSLSLPKFASSRFPIKSQASRTSLTPPPSERVSSKMTLPSQLTGTSQADPLIPTLHRVSQDKDSIELTQASQPADPSGENRSAEVRSAGDAPIDSTITGDNMQEITVDIAAEPLTQPQVKIIQRRPVDIKPDNVMAAGGHKDSTFPNPVNGPSTSGGERREDTVNSLNTPIEERNRESLKLLKAVDDRINELNLSTHGMQKLNSTTASALESLKMRVEDLGTCLNTKDELRHVEVIKAVEASSMQLDVLRACFRTEMKDECRSRTVEMVDATRKLLDNINESLQSLQQAQNQETRTALEAMEAQLHSFQNDAQTAQFTQRQEVTKALEETQVRMDKINASVLNLQNKKCLEADRMIEAVGSRMDVLQGDIQAMQGDQRTGAERIIEAIDSRLTEFRGDISILQESVQRLKEERDCLIKERADNEDRTQAVESLIAKLDSALDENASLSKDLERRVENELAAKSRCDDQWVQISQLQIQTQELDRQVASLKTERRRLQDEIDTTHSQAATIEAENQQLRSSLAQTAQDHDARLKSTISDFEKECTREAAEVEILNQAMRSPALHLSSITLLETDLRVKTELLQEQEERREILLREHEEHVSNVLKERDNQQQEIRSLKDRIYELEQDLEQQRHEKEQTATAIEQGKQTALSHPMLLTDIERAHIQELSKSSLNEFPHWLIDLTSSPDKPTYQEDSRVDFVKSEPASQDHVTTRSSSKRKAQQLDLECEADSAAKSGKRDDQTYLHANFDREQRVEASAPEAE